MQPDLSKQLQASFDHASLRHLAQSLKSEPAWQQVKEIKQRSEQALQFERDDFKTNYEARVLAEKRALQQKRSIPTLEPRAPYGMSRGVNMDRQAHRNVRQAHHQTIADIKAEETQALKALIDQHGHKPMVQAQSQRKAQSAQPHQHYKWRP